MEVHHRRRRSSPPAFLIPKLPPAYLLRALHSLSDVIAALSPPPSPPSLFKRSLISITRKCGILSVIFEEILCSPSSTLDSLSNSPIFCFEELFIVLQRIRVLIEDCSIGSRKMWLLMQAESITSCFNELTLDLLTLLEFFPKNELNLSEDVDELHEFLINCCNNHMNLIDLADNELRLTVLLLLDSIKREVIPDTSQLSETFIRLGLSDSARCREEIELLQDEYHYQTVENSRSDVMALVGLVRYARCVLFGGSRPSLAESTRWNSLSELNAPRGFQCPIRLDLMTDPVVVATGQTYNRLIYELRVLAKTDSDSRACIGEAGGIPLLVRFLGPDHPNLQVNAVTTILNLSILEANKGRIMESDGALNGLAEVLRCGATWEAKANAAATVFSLSAVSTYRKKLGRKSRVVKGLVELARVGPTSSKRDALVVILTLAGNREVAGRFVEGGAIDTLKEIMGELPEEAMTVLETVVKKGGLLAVVAARDMIRNLVALIRSGTYRTKESAVATLVIICRRGGAEMVADLARISTIEVVIWELMDNGTDRVKRKSASLMRILRRWSAELEGDVLEEFTTTMAITTLQ